MSTIIKFDLKELKKLATNKDSCVYETKVIQNLALQPWCLGNLKESIKNLLDYKIGKFDKEFDGILLSYKNLHILQNVGSIRNDNADIHFQVQADYFIFRPHVGTMLRGIVNKKSVTHLGILVHRVFNVVIPRPTEQPGNKWIGTSVQEGQEVVFRIVVLDLFGALPYIRGELDEKSLDGLDGGEPAEPIPITYVNFDKTKPTIYKQDSDELAPNTKTSKRTSEINGKASKHDKQSESTHKLSPNKTTTAVSQDKEDKSTEKPTKRLSKSKEPSLIPVKLSKKNRKET
ncbi:hypothetical protein JYU34_012631 [Plutella xylostella]|uniref:RPA43 OB domain-containing protein n=1 Tax=Plutella xylostella TaxID=51655 RepID=A0ABQ7QBU0_PLUXY|nr:hypothetical protein JYU34_012631 [Plutella xylostella]